MDLRTVVMALILRRKHAIGGVIPDFACWYYPDLDHRPALSICHHLCSAATGLGILCPGLVASSLWYLQSLSHSDRSSLWLSFAFCCHQEHLSNLKRQNATLLSLKPAPHDVREYSSPQQQGQSIFLPLEVRLALLSYEFRLQDPSVSQPSCRDPALSMPAEAAGPAEQSPGTIDRVLWWLSPWLCSSSSFTDCPTGSSFMNERGEASRGSILF